MAKMYNKNWSKNKTKSDNNKIVNNKTIGDVINNAQVLPPESITEVLERSGVMPASSITEAINKSNIESDDIIKMKESAGGTDTISSCSDDVLYMDDKLCIIPGNGLLPYFHFYRWAESYASSQTNDPLGGGIMIDRPLYFDHDGFQGTISEDEMDELIGFLKSKYSDDDDISVWQFLIKLWNSDNPLRVLDINTPIPDYQYDMPKYE